MLRLLAIFGLALAEIEQRIAGGSASKSVITSFKIFPIFLYFPLFRPCFFSISSNKHMAAIFYKGTYKCAGVVLRNNYVLSGNKLLVLTSM